MLNDISSARRLVLMGSALAAIALVSTGAAVYANAVLTSVTVARSVNVGSTIMGSARFNNASAGVRVVTLTSANPAILWVQASVPVQPGSVQSIPFAVRGVSPGCTTIKATEGGSSSYAYLIVHPASTGASFGLNVPVGSVVWYGSGVAHNASVTNAGTPLSGVVNLSSSNPAIIKVPPTASIVKGGSAPFRFTAVADGCATITARIGGQSASKTVQSVFIGG